MTQPVPSAEGATVSVAHRRALAVGLVLAVTTYAFDSLSVAAAMPAIVDDLGGVSLYGAAFSAFFLANMVSLAVSGPLADRHGPRPVLAAGLLSFAIGLGIGGLAPSMPVVVAGRAIQGLGAGSIGSCAYVVIGRAWPAEGRARMFAVMSAAWIVPSLVAPGAAGLVADHLSWRLVFLGLLPFPFVAAALALPPMHELGPAAPELVGDGVSRRRLADGTQLAVGALVLLVGLDAHLPLAVVPGVAAVAALVGLPAFRRLVPTGTLVAAAGLPAVVAARFLLNWAFFGTDSFIPLLVTDVKGSTVLVGGLALTSASLLWSAAAWAQSKLHDSYSEGTLVAVGLGLLGVGILIVATTLSSDIPLALVFVAWPIAGAGMGLAFNTASVAALARCRPGEEGQTGSALQIADSVGVALSTGLGGAVVAAGERGGWEPSSTLGLVLTCTFVAVVPGILAARRI